MWRKPTIDAEDLYSKETPPRMWRKLQGFSDDFISLRNTSTYVEKTLPFDGYRSGRRKHLHVCGENSRGSTIGEKCLETPPRMWRKLLSVAILSFHSRNTSTYVEKTRKDRDLLLVLQKHLHVCGENKGWPCVAARIGETPPRMWRKQKNV